MAEPKSTVDKLVQALTPYDVLGYLLPGGAFVVTVLAFESWARETAVAHEGATLHTPIYTLLDRLFSSGTGTDWVLQIFAVLMFAATIYVAGHLIASVSALAIDRTYVAKAHGYPYEQLLKITSSSRSALSADFYRALLFWLNVYLLLRFLALPDAVPLRRFLPSLLTELVPETLSQARLASVALWLSWLLVVLIIAKFVAGIETVRRDGALKKYVKSRFSVWLIRALKFLVYMAAAPSYLITNPVRRCIRSAQCLDEPTIEAFKSGLRRMLGFAPPEQSSSTYWYAVLLLRDRAPHLCPPIDNWLLLYSFARNLACALYLSFLYCFIWWFEHAGKLEFANPVDKNVLFALPLIIWASSFVMLLRYHYLYVDYYTKYLLRAVAYLGMKPGA